MLNIDKIIVTGDMLRPSEDGNGSNQKTNINWLYRLLKNALSLSTSLKVEVLNWEKNGFDSKMFFSFYGRQSMPEDWIALYHSDDISDDTLQYMRTFFQDSLVIGFELPELFMKIFNRLDIPYIDLIVHPIRYLDDIFLGMRTNHPSIFLRLQNYHLDSRIYSIYSGIHQASVSRMPREAKLEKGSALFAGQTEVDKSLIRGTQILSLLDFQEEFTEITQRYTKVYFKMHPYAKGDSYIDTFLQTFDNVELRDENFYYLLEQEEITAIYSISSGTVLEAKYWSKDAYYLYQNPYNLLEKRGEKFDNTAYTPIYDKFLLPSFWAEILSDVVETNQIAPIELPHKTNRLRNSLQNYWGYNFLDGDISIKHTNIPQQNRSNSKSVISEEMSVKEIMGALQENIDETKKRLFDDQQAALEFNLTSYQEMLDTLIATSLLKHPFTKIKNYKRLLEHHTRLKPYTYNASLDLARQNLLLEYRERVQTVCDINIKHNPLKKIYTYKKLVNWYANSGRSF